MRENWTKMVQALTAFKAKHGHCKVPAHYAENLQLGRWVAAQRYKHKVGDLPEAAVAQLDRVGFIWIPSDETWIRMCAALADYRKKHGNCNVPEHWKENRSLANWVQSQRYRKKKGKLPPDRVKQLETIGFQWSIYKSTEVKDPIVQRKPAVDEEEVVAPAGERLYVIRHSIYVQYSGKGPLPKELERYQRDNKGELPAYIPMPQRATTFYIGDNLVREKKVKWKGKGIVPTEILDYVKRNGTLPRYD